MITFHYMVFLFISLKSDLINETFQEFLRQSFLIPFISLKYFYNSIHPVLHPYKAKTTVNNFLTLKTFYTTITYRWFSNHSRVDLMLGSQCSVTTLGITNNKKRFQLSRIYCTSHSVEEGMYII